MEPWVRALDSLSENNIDLVWSIENLYDPIIEKIVFLIGATEIEIC